MPQESNFAPVTKESVDADGHISRLRDIGPLPYESRLSLASSITASSDSDRTAVSYREPRTTEDEIAEIVGRYRHLIHWSDSSSTETTLQTDPTSSQTEAASLSSAEDSLAEQKAPPIQTLPDRPTPCQRRLSSQICPDGGRTAWLQCLCGFFAYFCSRGIVNSFGMFQTYYDQHLGVSHSDNSWIGSISSFLMCFLTVFTGPVFDRGYGRLLLICGTSMVVFGFLMTSLSTKYYQILLAQGICVGIGESALFVVAMAATSPYFTTKRALAIGIAASGSALGGMIWPIIFQNLLLRIGFAWTIRVMALIVATIMTIPISVVRPITASHRRAFFDLSSFNDVYFNLFNVGCFLGGVGQYIPFFYMEEYAQLIGGMKSLSFYLSSILNAGSILGRILPAWLADHAGPLNVMSTCTFLAGVVAFTWIAAWDKAAIIIVSLLYGFFSGAFVSLQPATVASLTDDPKVLGERMGQNAVFLAFGTLVGNPIGGWILNYSKGHADKVIDQGHGWSGLQMLCGFTMLASGLVIFATRCRVAGFSIRARA